MFKNTKTFWVMSLILISLLLSACSGSVGAKPTEKEIVIDSEMSTPEPTATLRPTPTPQPPTLTPDPASLLTPTNTLDPYSALIAKGAELLTGEDFEGAMAQFNEAVKMDPNNPIGYYHRGRVYDAQQKYDEAITEFNFALTYDPTYAEAYNSRGIMWVQKQQFEQAIRDFDKTIELNPDYRQAYTNRAIAKMSLSTDEEGLNRLLSISTRRSRWRPMTPKAISTAGRPITWLANWKKR